MEPSKDTEVITQKTSLDLQTENGKPRSKKSRVKQAQCKPKETNAQEVPVPIPPDGGYGWVVTFCSFMVGFLVDGICFTFGFFFKEFQDYFGSNKSTTSSVSSVLNGTYLSIGKMKFSFSFPTPDTEI